MWSFAISNILGQSTGFHFSSGVVVSSSNMRLASTVLVVVPMNVDNTARPMKADNTARSMHKAGFIILLAEGYEVLL